MMEATTTPGSSTLKNPNLLCFFMMLTGPPGSIKAHPVCQQRATASVDMLPILSDIKLAEINQSSELTGQSHKTEGDNKSPIVSENMPAFPKEVLEKFRPAGCCSCGFCCEQPPKPQYCVCMPPATDEQRSSCNSDDPRGSFMNHQQLAHARPKPLQGFDKMGVPTRHAKLEQPALVMSTDGKAEVSEGISEDFKEMAPGNFSEDSKVQEPVQEQAGSLDDFIRSLLSSKAAERKSLAQSTTTSFQNLPSAETLSIWNPEVSTTRPKEAPAEFDVYIDTSKRVTEKSVVKCSEGNENKVTEKLKKLPEAMRAAMLPLQDPPSSNESLKASLVDATEAPVVPQDDTTVTRRKQDPLQRLYNRGAGGTDSTIIDALSDNLPRVPATSKRNFGFAKTPSSGELLDDMAEKFPDGLNGKTFGSLGRGLAGKDVLEANLGSQEKFWLHNDNLEQPHVLGSKVDRTGGPKSSKLPSAKKKKKYKAFRIPEGAVDYDKVIMNLYSAHSSNDTSEEDIEANSVPSGKKPGPMPHVQESGIPSMIPQGWSDQMDIKISSGLQENKKLPVPPQQGWSDEMYLKPASTSKENGKFSVASQGKLEPMDLEPKKMIEADKAGATEDLELTSADWPRNTVFQLQEGKSTEVMKTTNWPSSSENHKAEIGLPVQGGAHQSALPSAESKQEQPSELNRAVPKIMGENKKLGCCQGYVVGLGNLAKSAISKLCMNPCGQGYANGLNKAHSKKKKKNKMGRVHKPLKLQNDLHNQGLPQMSAGRPPITNTFLDGPQTSLNQPGNVNTPALDKHDLEQPLPAAEGYFGPIVY